MFRWVRLYKRPPSRSTLHHEFVTLRQVMKTAIGRGSHKKNIRRPMKQRRPGFVKTKELAGSGTQIALFLSRNS